MSDFDKALARFAANPLRGRVGRDQLGMSRLELLQLVHHAIEFRVADLRIVEHVIAILVMPDLFAQSFDLRFNAFGRSSHSSE